MNDRKNQRGLGRGLSALLADVNIEDNQPKETPRGEQFLIDIDQIFPNPNQPRRRFKEENLEELSKSIQVKGVIQPLIVRPKDGGYEIVAGERRWRAAQRAHVHQVPVIIREYSDVEVLEIAIIENIQRQELNVLEEAEAFQQLMDKFGHTQEALASALGKSRSHIANMLRLNSLDDTVKGFVRDDKLSMGHARALLPLSNAGDVARKIVSQGLSVRDTEALVRKTMNPVEKKERPKKAKASDTELLEDDLKTTLGMAVDIDHKDNGSGRVVISYKTLEDLDRLVAILATPKYTN